MVSISLLNTREEIHVEDSRRNIPTEAFWMGLGFQFSFIETPLIEWDKITLKFHARVGKAWNRREYMSGHLIF